MSPRLLAATCLVLVACAEGRPYGTRPADDDPDAAIAPGVDAALADGAEPDAAVAPPAAVAAPLLLTEVMLAPTTAELIEIANPTAETGDLSRYYLSDVPTYFRLPAGDVAVSTADVIARFPAGASLGPGEVVVVALGTASGFTAATGVAPDYSIADGTMVVVESSGAPTLTNDGEVIALFFWDGVRDLVTDVDLLVAGTPTTINAPAPKGAVALDGPDEGAQLSSYRAEAGTIAAQAAAPGSGLSTKRILLEAGHETQNGQGNGAAGHDETSEATAQTWDATFTAATPGTTALLF